MSEIRAWVDGRLIGAGVPALSPVDHGVTVGDGGFETAKVEFGQVFAMTRHLDRLNRTLAGLGLPAPDHERIREGIDAVLAIGPMDFGRVRVTVTAGVGPLGSDRGDSPMTYIVTAVPHPRPGPSGTVVSVDWVRNERSATAGMKTTSYADNVVALAHARSCGAEEAVMANTRGELCEGTASNVFVVTDGVLRTPPLSSGCLAGITRALVLEWCRSDGLEVATEPLPMGILADADEVFITSSLRDVYPVSAVDGRVLAAPGPLTARATHVWQHRVAGGIDP
ncbi:MAG: aminotransferase class IV [Dermatophilaceae bacterium]